LPTGQVNRDPDTARFKARLYDAYLGDGAGDHRARPQAIGGHILTHATRRRHRWLSDHLTGHFQRALPEGRQKYSMPEGT